MSYDVKVTRNLEIPMRDGTVLRADLFQPQLAEPQPVLLSRTPYNKDGSSWTATALRYASEGYAVLIQDCRGRFSSDGIFYPMLNEVEDGYDSIEWAASQPWARDSVGMFGASYVGATQWLAAAGAPPHLKAIAPGVTGCNYHDGWFYQGGAFLLGFVLNWTLGSLATPSVERLNLPAQSKSGILAAITDMLDHPGKTLAHLPLTDVSPLGTEGLAPYYLDWLAHPDYDKYWSQWDISTHHASIMTPALSIGGWYDYFLNGTLRNFTGMKAHGSSKVAQSQRLIVGPWSHNIPLFGPNQGEFTFGPRSLGTSPTGLDLDGIALRWFDYWLKGIDDGIMSEPPVKLFTIGANRWQSYDDWPVPGSHYATYYLHSEGTANSAAGDGRLRIEPPENQPPDVYLYDPRRPVPTKGGATGRGGIYDQRSIENRQDVLVYTSEPLSQDTEVTGPIVVKIWAATSAKDTDFTAKLVDVAPSGLALNLADNLVRGRYLNSPDKPTLLDPGRPFEVTIDLFGTSNLFKQGHCIRLEVTSSNFPRFDRNPNTGAPFATSDEMVPALQTVFHDTDRPSSIVLPVVAS